MRMWHGFCLLFVLATMIATGQTVAAPEPQAGSISGYATDTVDAQIPGATVLLDGPGASDHRELKADAAGRFMIPGVRPGVAYRVTVRQTGFAEYKSAEIVLPPGGTWELGSTKLAIASVESSIDAISPEQMAIEQVNAETQQRVLGVIPNFYVVYDGVVAPLSTKLKYKLAFRASTDVVSFGAAAFLAGINQAAHAPDYVEGAKGYGQRLGAAYADATTDIFIGGAILPSLLHQDPRYYYQGTGTKKSRAEHALLSPFICLGDNGKKQFNFSSVGGDLGSGALSNLYYPVQDRGVGLVFSNALVTTGGRMANALLQEFVLRKLTSRGKVPLN